MQQKKTRSPQEIAQDLYAKASRMLSTIEEKLSFGKPLSEKEKELCNAVKGYGKGIDWKDNYLRDNSCIGIYTTPGISAQKYKALAKVVKSDARNFYTKNLKNAKQIQLM